MNYNDKNSTKLSPYPKKEGFRPKSHIPVGGVVLAEDPIEFNAGRQTIRITVRNRGDRPIQVGSHYHFFEVNRYMEFDRAAAFGCHLNIPATTAIRFEPGDQKEVELVPFAGKQRIVGFNNLTKGCTATEHFTAYLPTRIKALIRAETMGFANATAEKKSTTKSKTKR